MRGGERYAYQLRRTVSATAATGWTGSDDQAVRDAKRSANETAEDQLRGGFECVPCLHCGHFQAEMVDEMCRRKVKGKTLLMYACGGLAIAAACLAAIITMAMVSVPDKNNTGLPLIITAVSWAVVVPFVLGAGVFFALRRSAMAAFDPYNGKSEGYWKRQARELGAVTLDEMKATQESRRAAEEADVAAQAGLNFEDDAKRGRKPPPGAKAPPPSPPPDAAPADKNPFDFS